MSFSLLPSTLRIEYLHSTLRIEYLQSISGVLHAYKTNYFVSNVILWRNNLVTTAHPSIKPSSFDVCPIAHKELVFYSAIKKTTIRNNKHKIVISRTWKMHGNKKWLKTNYTDYLWLNKIHKRKKKLKHAATPEFLVVVQVFPHTRLPWLV
jgi:hypothetical protein